MCITKHPYSSDLWPLKMKRNCIVEKSLAVRIVDHKSLALRLSTGLSLYLQCLMYLRMSNVLLSSILAIYGL